ncbi:MAG: nicotinate phosphoribosyltransferase [Theionarchaea archaeon]|nr:nicotinate phosphoribosyltransferase [Theionarchaea archaeon]
MSKLFFVASDEEIKNGKTTDIYFERTEEILRKKAISKSVAAEVTCGGIPNSWPWGIFLGTEDVARLFEGIPVTVYSLREGTFFRAKDDQGIRTPVVLIEGDYASFCVYETPLLGFICQASGIATAAARVKKVAGEKTVLSFGARRMHPSITPMISRACYLAGFDGVSAVISADMLHIPATGTMPHALVIIMQDHAKAWKAFDEIVDKTVSRVALCDTYLDEKLETLMAATAVKDLSGVRLDTPGSRRGNFKEIIQEVRWELNLRGYSHIKIFVSGGLDEDSVQDLKPFVDGFGVGTYVSNGRTIDFSMDIVEMEDQYVAKRGKFSGKKQIYRCKECLRDVIVPWNSRPPECHGKMEPLLEPLVEKGTIVQKFPSASKTRDHVLEQVSHLDLF